MHIASVAIFEGPPPAFADIVAMVDAKLDLVPRYRQKVRFVPLELGPARVGGRPALQHRVPPPPHRAARRPGARPSCASSSAGSWPSSSTGPSRCGRSGWSRGSRTGAGPCCQDPPRHGRRRVGHGPAGGDHGPQSPTRRGPSRRPGHPARRRRASSWSSTRSRTSSQSPTSSCGRRARSTRGAAARRRARSLEVAGGLSRLGGLVRPTPLSSLNGPIGPHRRYAWATTIRRRHQGGAQGARRHLQRRGAGRHHQRVPGAAAVAGRDVDRVVRTLVPVSVRPRDAVGQGRRRRHLREQGLGHVRRAAGRASTTRSSGSTPSPRRWRT